jgi:hypothetical protein
MSIDYARMPMPLRWLWHAEVYALRRVMLDVPHHEHTSPCDPKGEWYDEHAVAEAEAKLRAKLAEQLNRCASDTAARNAIRMAEAAAWRERRTGIREAAE